MNIGGPNRWRIGTKVMLPILAVASLLFALNIWAYKNLGRLDLTSAQVYSISPETRRIIAQVKQPVNVTWFYDLRNKSMVDALDLLKQYQKANPLIQVRGVDPGLHPALARQFGIQFAGSAVFQAPGKTITINGGTETDFSNGLIHALTQVRQTICFTQGHLESNPFSLMHLDDNEDHGEDENVVARIELHERHGMAMARNALETLGYTVRSVLPAQGLSTYNGCDLVIVAGPKRAFQPRNADVLNDYLLKGGSAMLMLEPDSDHGLDRVLDSFGIRHRSGAVSDMGQHYQSDATTPAVSDYTRHAITRNVPVSVFPGVSSFTPAENGLKEAVVVTPLVLSSEKSYLGRAKEELDRRTLMLIAARRIADAPLAQGGKRASLVLAGDADFATNHYYALLGNAALFLNTVNYMTRQNSLIDIQPRHYQAKGVRLTNRQMQSSFFISSVLLPSIAVAVGLILWWRRR
ncbi:MAG TPA: DUF4350 domain-containing protein [Candidimonas sp.]|nr:DUF4350 domain-containing protein [Candidimonas sp.]